MSSLTANDVPASQQDNFVAEALRRRRNARVQSIALGIGLPVLLIALWQVAAQLNWIDRRFFPAPTTIGVSMFEYLTSSANRAVLLEHVLATLRRVGIGYGLGATIGVTVGVVMGLHRQTRWAVSPMLYGLFPMPKIAIYPLMIVIFGLGDASTSALVTLGVFFMTCINTLSGIRYTNAIYHDVADAFRFPPMTRWFRVFIPSAMPSILTGLRLGLGQALILVVAAEFVSADRGIGRFIWDSWQILDISRMFMGLGIVLLFGGTAAVLGNIAEQQLIPWHRR